MPDYAGYNPLAILSPHFNSITLATDGFPLANAEDIYESAELGLREPSEFVAKATGEKDATERSHLQSYEVTGKIPMLQTDLATLKNVYLWSGGLVQAWAALTNGKYLNFVKNANGLPTPNGSCMFGILPEFTLDAKKRVLDLSLTGHLYSEELVWLADNDATAHAGGSGGVARGLTEMGYDRTKRKRGNVTDIHINDVSVGFIKDDMKFSLKGGGNKLNPNQTVSEYFDYSLSVMLRQADKVAIKAVNHFADTDAVVLLKCAGGDQIKIHNPGQMGEVHWDEKESGIKLDVAGRVYRNADEETPNQLDIGVTAAAVFEILSTW